MVSKLIIYLILVAASTFHSDAVIVFDNVYYSCGIPTDTTAGSALVLSDVVNMAKASGSYMDQAESGQISPWDLFRVTTMFHSIYDATQGDAQVRKATVRGYLKTMENVATTQINIWVSCDDTKLFFTDEGGQYFLDPYTRQKEYLRIPVVTCANPVVIDGVTRYQLGYQSPIGNVRYIIICANNPQIQGKAITLGRQTYTAGSELASLITVSTSLFHELTHALIDTMVGDQAGGVAAGGERYGWVGVQEIRSAHSVNNPDSLVFFAMALSMEEYLWDDGIAMTLATQYALLQGKPEGQMIITKLGLTDPSVSNS